MTSTPIPPPPPPQRQIPIRSVSRRAIEELVARLNAGAPRG